MKRIAVIGIRVFLGLIFFSAGLGKLTHGLTPGLIGPVWLEERLAQYGLSLWAQFVAWSQLLIGALLLSQRFALLGAVMLVPMLVNILVVTISLQWRGTPYVNAVLLAMNLFLLWVDRERLKPLVQ
ncbi:MAG TPA: DoxX family membrane protein [Thermoanaerobaculia bacterium]